MKVKAFAQWIREVLEKPRTVFVSCVALVFMSLLLNGTFWRLWNLQRDKERKQREMLVTMKETDTLKTQLLQAKDPAFIEHQAKDRLDFAGENDLVFVFAAQ